MGPLPVASDCATRVRAWRSLSCLRECLPITQDIGNMGKTMQPPTHAGMPVHEPSVLRVVRAATRPSFCDACLPSCRSALTTP